MKIEAPCRMGERFTSARSYTPGRFVLTGLDFFAWQLKNWSPVTLNGKIHPHNKLENSKFFEPKDTAEGAVISFEVPDALVLSGCRLRDLGLDTDAVGHLTGLNLTEDGWEYYIYYGRQYGGPLERTRNDVLDKLFEPVLPLRAVRLNVNDFLI